MYNNLQKPKSTYKVHRNSQGVRVSAWANIKSERKRSSIDIAGSLSSTGFIVCDKMMSFWGDEWRMLILGVLVFVSLVLTKNIWFRNFGMKVWVCWVSWVQTVVERFCARTVERLVERFLCRQFWLALVICVAFRSSHCVACHVSHHAHKLFWSQVFFRWTVSLVLCSFGHTGDVQNFSFLSRYFGFTWTESCVIEKNRETS